ncbi:MAG: toll/interleukin-1 receptor domain-containing protein [Pseudomonadota bacterium]
MSKIFISYRREDSQWQTKAIYEALSGYVADPKTDIFYDLDSMTIGQNFRHQIEESVAKCDVMLVVIGQRWLKAKNAETGARRLDDPRDFVRAEVLAALDRGIPVVPVLLDGVQVPEAHELPNEINELSERQGVKIRAESFENDLGIMIKGLQLRRYINEPEVSSTKENASYRVGYSEPRRSIYDTYFRDRLGALDLLYQHYWKSLLVIAVVSVILATQLGPHWFVYLVEFFPVPLIIPLAYTKWALSRRIWWHLVIFPIWALLVSFLGLIFFGSVVHLEERDILNFDGDSGPFYALLTTPVVLSIFGKASAKFLNLFHIRYSNVNSGKK